MSKRKWKKPMNTFLSVGLAVSIIVPTLYTPVQAATHTSDVLISEYIEGSSFNKAIELYNGTGADINLANYSLELYSNGATSPSQTLKLSGTIKNGDTYVLYHKDANADIKSKGDLANTTVINFNGDDAIVLKKDGSVIDSIGQAGARVNNMADVTLVRNNNVVSGDKIIDDAFDPAVEWTTLPKDDSSNLGIHGSSTDIIEDATIVQPVVASAEEGYIAKGTVVTLTSTTPGATVYYTTDGTEPTTASNVYSEAIVIDENMTLKAMAIKEGLTDSSVSTFEYTVFDPEQGMQIHHLQGAGHQSPVLNEKVANIKGIVTYEYKIGSGNYFHMQTPDELKDNDPKTSEGIVVYTGNKAANVEVGDLVSVNGTVNEYHIDGYYDTKSSTDLPVTQINARDDQGGIVTVEASDQSLPEPVVIDDNLPTEVIDNDSFAAFDPEEDAIDFWESIEGMLVEVGNVKAVAPQEHGDLITVLEDRVTDTIHGGVLLTEDDANADRIQFKLFDNSDAREFEVATGDTFNGPITGVVNYGFQNYKIYADYETVKEKHVEGNAKPEQTTIEFDKQKLTIASYNLENFSNNRSETSDDKAQKLARAFAKDMQNPDIIGVTEVQDNNGAKPGDSAANESYERLIAEIEKAGGVKYEYVNIDPVNNADGGAPNANIRVGFLYNPDRVKLTKGMPQGDATTAVGYEKGKLTLNPGRIDPTNEAFKNSRKPLAAQFNFRGEDVVVIVNHWNSKTGDTPLFGSTQPPVYGSEVQRHKIANVVNDFIEEVVSENPGANIVSVGDFNDFQFSETLKIHEGEHMTNMINTVDKADRYTYLFQGNSQVLDHILVSNHLADTTKTDILHINADFTDMAGRASDHDPVLVQIDVKDKKHKKEQVNNRNK